MWASVTHFRMYPHFSMKIFFGIGCQSMIGSLMPIKQ